MTTLGTVVTKDFRDRTLRQFPALAHDRHYLAFLDLLLFGSFLEGSTRPQKVLPHRTILEALGMSPTTRAREFTSGAFIDDLNKKVLGGKLLVGPYSHVRKKSRTVSINNLGKAFLDSLNDELASFHRTDNDAKIYFVSGEPWRSLNQTELRNADLAAAGRFPGVVSEAQRLITYLNALPSNLFTSSLVGKNMAKAVTIAEKISNATVRRHQLALLHRITSQPQPFYGASADQKTVRIFARNPSLLQLRNDVKQALTADWKTFDLRSAQLAIIAKDWGVTSLAKLLADSSKNVWKELSATLGKLPVDVAKAAVKKGVYAIAYGAGKATVGREIKSEIEDSLDEDRDVDVQPFFDHELVKDLFLYRTATLDVVRKGRAVFDCFGRKLTCKTSAQARSVLAQLSQAQEMQLLLPALDLAEKRPSDLRIMLWEHDGFTVHLRRPDRNESTKRALVKAVNDHCKKLGYLTELVEK